MSSGISPAIFSLPGPVAAGFYACDDFSSSISGPYGSGKTTLIIARGLRIASKQLPNANGDRYCKIGIIRDTYPNLWKSTIKTFKKVFDENASNITFDGTKGRQANFNVVLGHPDGGLMYIDFEFIAIGEHDVESVLGGYELTAAVLDEAADLDISVSEFIGGRVGRYPSGHMGKCGWYGVMMVFNKPDKDHWLYDYCVTNPPKNHTHFDQAGGLIPCDAGAVLVKKDGDGNDVVGSDGNPIVLSEAFETCGKWWIENRDAENFDNLPENYYYNAAVRMKDLSKIKRMLVNDWAPSKKGEPVYADVWSAENHQVSVSALPNAPIICGADAGRQNPAIVLGQYDTFGQFRIIDEYIGENIGASRFGEAFINWFRQEYSQNSIECIWGDPAGMARWA